MKEKYMVNIKYLIVMLFLTCCSRKFFVEPEFPKEMLPHVKEQYAEQWNRGKNLYAANCLKCHYVNAGRKKMVPDFTEDQLKGYALRISNQKHESALPDSLVSEEDLITIMTFLRYKKKYTKN
ncbi:MAG: c-type cytochrome [Bacteroidia bacterium]|nr:c-type cytochrome [Bacteroidia bacterium]